MAKKKGRPLKIRSAGPDDPIGAADPCQLDLFEQRGPGRAADRATILIDQGIAKAVAGIREAAQR